jgi:hypothetical protein
MDKSLLQYAYVHYAADIPHDNIIQGLINKGAEFDQAQQILDTASVIYCTKAAQTAQPQSEPEEEMGIGGIIKLILTIGSLLYSVAQCAN